MNTLKKKEYVKALFKYKQVFLYTKGLLSLREEQKQRIKEICLISYINQAAVQMTLKNYDKAIPACNSALELDPNNVKALFRRGKIYSIKNDLDNAKKDLLKAAKLDPQDKTIREEYEKLRVKYQEHSQKQKKLYSHVFKKINEEDKAQAESLTATDEKPSDKGETHKTSAEPTSESSN